MPNCPKCGEPMKIGAMQFDQPLYNCDKCGIDCYRPDKEKSKPKSDLEEKTSSKKTKKKKS